jgi:hypothetical protein
LEEGHVSVITKVRFLKKRSVFGLQKNRGRRGNGPMGLILKRNDFQNILQRLWGKYSEIKKYKIWKTGKKFPSMGWSKMIRR